MQFSRLRKFFLKKDLTNITLFRFIIKSYDYLYDSYIDINNIYIYFSFHFKIDKFDFSIFFENFPLHIYIYIFFLYLLYNIPSSTSVHSVCRNVADILDPNDRSNRGDGASTIFGLVPRSGNHTEFRYKKG